jgi:RNA polymerase sigma factor (sigma-70 family)
LQPLARAVLRTQSDARLVALARDGKEAAFEEIVRRYRPALVAFAAAYGPPDPEDVVQESLLRSWDALRESTGEMHLKAWLYAIVRNRALNARRDSRPHEQLTEGIDGVPQPQDIVLSNDELQRAVMVISALPDQQREALVRSALEGHTHDQIAAAIGSTPGAVRQLIYRGRMTVRHGVGAVIPLPLVASLADLGGGGAAAGGAAGGAAMAGVAGGTSVAAKVALVAAIGAVAVGSGAAIKHAGGGDKTGDQTPHTVVEQAGSSEPGDAPRAASAAAAQTASPSSGTDDHGGDRSSESSSAGGSSHDAHGDSGGEGPDDSGGADGGSGPGDSSGPGPGVSGEPEPGDDHGGPGPSSGGDDSPGSGSSGSGSSGSGSSGSGSSGSGSSGSGSSGSGSSGSGSSGSSTSGSSSGGSGSSGSGGGDDGLATTVPEADTSGSSGSGGSGGSGSGSNDGLEATVPDTDHSGPG